VPQPPPLYPLRRTPCRRSGRRSRIIVMFDREWSVMGNQNFTTMSARQVGVPLHRWSPDWFSEPADRGREVVRAHARVGTP
jgi:hypothetical protein